MLPSRSELEAERARRSLRVFLRCVWPSIDPGSEFAPGVHVEAICSQLEAVARGEIRRLVINVPPRHGKSLITSVAFPAWSWITRPQLRFLFASYGIELASRDSVRCRRLVESAWFRQRYGDQVRLCGDQNQKTRFENERGGVRLATSVGGAATGEGGDVIVVDDPLKIEAASSDSQRQAAIEWFDQTIATRLNDPRTGAIVVIGQRLHERDLFGHLLEQGGWTHLCLPAEFEPTHPFRWADDPRTVPGELLWPQRYGREELEALKTQLGSYGAAGQLQQLPAPAGGGIFDRSWWRYYDPSRPPPIFDEIYQSWDLAFTDSPNADFVVGQAWGIAGPSRYLLRQIRAQLAFTQTLEAIRGLTTWLNQRYPSQRGHAILVEKSANGAAVLDVLSRELPGVIPVVPAGNKLGRAHAASPQVEAGNVHLPGSAALDGRSCDRARTPGWVQALIEEAAAFPNAAHDDQVDALTQALDRASRPGPRLRVLTGPPARHRFLAG